MEKKILLPIGGLGVVIIAAAGFWMTGGNRSSIPDPPIPGNLETYESTLVDLIHKGRLAVIEDIDEADRWLELGMVYLANKNQVLALECFEQAVRLDPQCPRCWYYVAQVRNASSEYDAAIEAMGRVVELQGDYAPASWRLGFWQLELGDVDGAEASFDRAMRLSSRDPAGRFGMARVRMRQQRDEEAARLLEDLLDWTPINRYHANFLLGTVYRRLGRTVEAERLLMGSEGPPIMWPDPWTNEITRYFRGDTWKIDQPIELMAQGRIDEAIAMLEGLLRSEPENIDLLNNLAIAHRGKGDLLQSNAILEKIIELREQHYLAHNNLGLNYMILAQQETDANRTVEYERLAFHHTEMALEINPAYTDARGLHAQLLEGRGDDEAALEEYRIAADDPTRGMYWLDLMIARLAAMSRWDEAADVLNELTYRFVPQPVHLMRLVIVLLEAGRLEEAQQTADRYARLWPADGRVMELRQMIQTARDMPAPPDENADEDAP